MPRPPLPPGYQPSPQPSKIYSGPAIPLAYDSNWQFFTNLTQAQIAWFQAQPEWQNFLSYVALSPTTAASGAPIGAVNGTLQGAGQTIVTAKPIIAL